MKIAFRPAGWHPPVSVLLAMLLSGLLVAPFGLLTVTYRSGRR
jgi:hypothetical protein